MKLIKTIDLPVHSGNDGFDHADIHFATSRLYVAHTLNHAIDVIDCEKDEYLSSIADCPGVAGILVSNTRDLMFSSNRGEDTVSIFSTTLDEDIGMLAAGKIPINKVNVGQGPNGMAFDATRGTLLVANVGRGGASGSPSVSIIDVKQTREVARISMLGRTRWAMYDASQDMFFVNIANPASIVCIDAKRPREIARTIPVPVAGPHGLGIDTLKARLLCACDAAVMAAIDLHSGEILEQVTLSGAPDVVLVDEARRQAFVAVGDLGVVDVIDLDSFQRVRSFATEKGAHTLALDSVRHKLYGFFPESHRAAVFSLEDKN